MKNTIMRVLNLALYLSFCLMAGTGLLLEYRLPPGSRGGRGLTLLGMDRHDWGEVHLWVSFALLGLLVLHLVLHWRWLWKIAASGHGWRLAAGLLAGAAIIAAFFLLPIEREERRGPGAGFRNQSR